MPDLRKALEDVRACLLVGDRSAKEDALAIIAQALASLPQADGFVRVPREPTEEMFVRGDEAIIEHLQDYKQLLGGRTPAQSCWAAMLASAAPAPTGGEDDPR